MNSPAGAYSVTATDINGCEAVTVSHRWRPERSLVCLRQRLEQRYPLWWR